LYFPVDTPRPLTVVALCAAWCHTCEEFLPAFRRIARDHPGSRFVWLDIEDDAAIVGDIDVEDFPTLAIYDGASLVHYGASLPHEVLVRRLVAAFAEPGHRAIDEPAAAASLPLRLGPAG
jgi:thioredoxin 1